MNSEQKALKELLDEIIQALGANDHNRQLRDVREAFRYWINQIEPITQGMGYHGVCYSKRHHPSAAYCSDCQP